MKKALKIVNIFLLFLSVTCCMAENKPSEKSIPELKKMLIGTWVGKKAVIDRKKMIEILTQQTQKKRGRDPTKKEIKRFLEEEKERVESTIAFVEFNEDGTYTDHLLLQSKYRKKKSTWSLEKDYDGKPTLKITTPDGNVNTFQINHLDAKKLNYTNRSTERHFKYWLFGKKTDSTDIKDKPAVTVE